MCSLTKLVLGCQQELLQSTKQAVMQYHLLRHSTSLFRDCGTDTIFYKIDTETLSSRSLTTYSRQSFRSRKHFIENSGTYSGLKKKRINGFLEPVCNSISCRLSSHKPLESHEPLEAKFTQEIDIDKLRNDLRKERKKGSKIQLSEKIKEAVKAKCDEAVANLSEEEQKQLKVIQLEHSFLHSEGYEILSPEEMISQYWLEALRQTTKMGRLKHYLFLQRREYQRASELKKREESREQKDAESGEEKQKSYYEHGRLFMRIYESTMRRWLSYGLASSMQFGIPLVFDMNFHKQMRPQDVRNTAKQLLDVYSFNRLDQKGPFHLHMLNCQEDNSTYKMFQILLQDIPDVLLTVSEKSYLDKFNKKDLIYLSPNGRQVMRKFDPNAVYIVGAYNDKSNGKPITYARAKSEGLRCQRLPLDEHLDWGQGGKDLTLDQVMRILLALKNKQQWSEALKVIPKRKLMRQNVK